MSTPPSIQLEQWVTVPSRGDSGYNQAVTTAGKSGFRRDMFDSLLQELQRQMLAKERRSRALKDTEEQVLSIEHQIEELIREYPVETWNMWAIQGGEGYRLRKFLSVALVDAALKGPWKELIDLHRGSEVTAENAILVER